MLLQGASNLFSLHVTEWSVSNSDGTHTRAPWPECVRTPAAFHTHGVLLAGLADSASTGSAASTQYCLQQDLLPLVLELLAALLLEPCAARPAVGGLDPSLAADSALALLQVCLGDGGGGGGGGWRGLLSRTVVWCGVVDGCWGGGAFSMHVWGRGWLGGATGPLQAVLDAECTLNAGNHVDCTTGPAVTGTRS